MKLRPLHDRVVVRRIEGEDQTKGGIIILDTAKEKPQEGKVIAAGPGARDESGKLVPLDVKAGDRGRANSLPMPEDAPVIRAQGPITYSKLADAAQRRHRPAGR